MTAEINPSGTISLAPSLPLTGSVTDDQAGHQVHADGRGLSLVSRLSHWLFGHSFKIGLYTVIATLGLLPVVGAIVTLMAFSAARSDHAELDRAIRGALALERINGIVYAVVMESRGVYMSSAWSTAEPFAKRLVVGLGGLKQEARALHEAVRSARNGTLVDLLTRLDQFVDFRTELVRIAEHESTVAARNFGDNEANRTVRAALNDSLKSISAAFASEITEFRERIAVIDQRIIAALASLAIVAVGCLAAGLALVRSTLLAPLFKIKTSMLRLSNGQLDIDMTSRSRHDEIGEMAQAVDVFRAATIDRRKQSREAVLLSQLNEWLQSCKSLDELYRMVGDFLARLLPKCGGSLYIYANSRDVLESAHTWNGGTTLPTIHPDDC